MIFTPEFAKPLLNQQGNYTGLLTTKKWGYHFFKEEVSPTGNIVVFEAPLELGALKLTNALVLAIELPHCNAFGSACFSRLYCAQLGSLLSECLDKECYVDANCHIIEDKQCSLTLNKIVLDTALINVVISLCKENRDILHPAEVNAEFKQKAIDSFYYLTKSIFIETQRDNL